jgi:ADP-ribose pyrophosphatase
MAGENPPPFQSFIRDGAGWGTVSNDLKYANAHVQVYQSVIRTPSRPDGALWTVIHRKGATVIAPMTADGRLVLIRQERIPVRATLWEFPAGQIDSAGEPDDATIRATALRELQEETGYELGPGGELLPMGMFFSSPGFTDEHGHLFLARGVVPSPGGSSHEEAEAIEDCRAFTIAEIRRMIAENEIRDANTLSTFARMCVLGYLD